MPKSILTATADFTVASGTLVVGDPIVGGQTIENVRKGQWAALVEMSSDNTRVSYITAFSVEVDVSKAVDDDTLLDTLIDTGNLAICDGKYFKAGDGDACEDLLDTADPFGSFFNGRGVVTQSGYGDGKYPVVLGRVRGKVVEVTVYFMFEDGPDLEETGESATVPPSAVDLIN